MPTRLELSIAWRYLRGRRGSKLLSFISAIAVGGVVVGVAALIVVMGVMNGLQHDLREKPSEGPRLDAQPAPLAVDCGARDPTAAAVEVGDDVAWRGVRLEAGVHELGRRCG